MNPSVRRSSLTASSCPRCGHSSASPFSAGGVCLRCAGERVLAIESGIPFPPAATSHGGPVEFGDLPVQIGAYEIIEELGRGGMGRVLAARQSDLGRIVALKVLPTGAGAADLELRFLREAQTVARLRHPHVIAIHDSGRVDGYVYFSMDYIEGGDLAKRIRAHPFASQAAAALLQKVATALAYTHSEGVLHRDLKPSNILLDGDEPRVADFGLAAQLESGGDLTMASGVLGTPHYVAPEALRGGSAALNVASDIYALGVVMFELLTGRTPFAGTSPAELAALLEKTDPPSPRLLAPAVPRDLDTICLKCLERDPAKRYASAQALADDLRRFLAGEPIAARPPGRLERFARFASRHRPVFIAGGVAAITLVTAAIAGTSLAVRATNAEKHAVTEAAVAKAVSEFLQTDLLGLASPDREPDREIKLRTVLDRAAKNIDGRFAAQPAVELALRETLASTYQSLGEYAREKVQLERGIELSRQLRGPRDPETLRGRSELAGAQLHLGDTAGAIALATETRQTQQTVLGPEHVDTLQTTLHLSEALERAGQSAAAEKLLHETLAIAERTAGPDHRLTIDAKRQLADALSNQGQAAAAQAMLLAVVESRRRTAGPEHPSTLRAMSDLASAYQTAGKPADAERLFDETLAIARRVLGPDEPDTVIIESNLAVSLRVLGKLAEAQKLISHVLETRRRINGPDHPDTLSAMNSLATVYYSLGKPHEAGALLAETVERLTRVQGAEHPDTVRSKVNLAAIYDDEGRTAEAAALAAEGLSAAQKVFGPEHPATLYAMNTLGQIYQEQGRLDQAVALQVPTLEIRRRVLGPEHPTTLSAMANLAATYRDQNRLPEAATLLQQAAELRQKKLGPDNSATIQTLDMLGTVMVLQGKFAEAETILRDALARRRKTTPNHWRVFETQSRLGEALAGLGKFPEAETTLVTAHAGLERALDQIPERSRSSLTDAAARLVRLYESWGKAADAEAWRQKLPGAAPPK